MGDNELTTFITEKIKIDVDNAMEEFIRREIEKEFPESVTWKFNIIKIGKAINKFTPRIPKSKETYRDRWGDYWESGHCPACGRKVYEEEDHFCGTCGQGLDWTREFPKIDPSEIKSAGWIDDDGSKEEVYRNDL